jgi:uncharacterized caspase-like protein
MSASQGFAEIRTKPKGTFISYSTAPGEVAVDGSNGHSPFAAALAETVQQPGLDLPAVFQRVREKVLAATAERQTPWDSSSLVKSFYFIPPPAEETEEQLIAALAPMPELVAKAPAESGAPVVRQAEAAAPVAETGPAPVAVAEAETAKPKPAFVAATRSLFAKSGSRLRAEPSKNASIVAKLPANAEIRAVARSADGAWWEVSAKGRTAYIHADAVSDFRAAKAPKRTTQPQTAALPPKPTARTTAKKPETGIQLVDNALTWLSQASDGSGPAPTVTRASR